MLPSVYCPCCGRVSSLEEEKKRIQEFINRFISFTGSTSVDRYGIIIFTAASDYLKQLGFKNYQYLAHYMVLQSKHETFYQGSPYNSPVFKKNNNAFGYKYVPGAKYQLSRGSESPEGNAYAKYSSVIHSALEVAAWIGRRKAAFENIMSVEEYARMLKLNAYYGAPESAYLAGMKKFMA